MKIKIFMTLVALSIVAFLAFKREGISDQCGNCNVILISIDSLRADHMSVYGYQRDTTPFLKQLSNKSLVFNNFFSSSYLTPISEGSIHTGVYPEKNGVINFKRQFSTEIKTFAEIMKERGYTTMAIGNSHEFRRFKALESSFKRGFDYYEIFGNRLSNNRQLDLSRFTTLLQIANAKKKPFFAWVTIGSVHAPFSWGLPNYFVDNSYSGILSKIRFDANMQYYYDHFLYDPLLKKTHFKMKGNAHYTTPDIKEFKFPAAINDVDLQFVKDSYDNGIRAADLEVEKIFGILDKLQLTKNTVVVIQSEHGENIGENKYIAHYDILDTTTHVPLIIKSPTISSFAKVDALISGVDVLPTVLRHLNLKFNLEIDGKAFPIEKAKTQTTFRSEVYFTRTPLWEHLLVLPDQKNSLFDRFREAENIMEFKDYGVRSIDRKLIHRKARFAEELYSSWTFISGKKISREEYEIYDLKMDPTEEHPLPITTPEDMDLKNKLLSFELKMSKEARKTSQIVELQEYK